MADPSSPNDGGRSRRRFLVESASALSAVAIGAPRASGRATEDATSARTLRAVAEVALPVKALGHEGVEAAVARFERWRDGFRPVAELDHPYLSTDQLRYGPPDPRPGWSAQLEALEIESRERFAQPYADLEPSARGELLDRHLRRHLPRNERREADLPHPAEAAHVALALIAWFYATPAANDLCHGRAIRRHSCRGLPSAVDEPPPLGDRSPFADE